MGEVGFSRPFGFLDAGHDINNTIRTIFAGQKYNGIVGQIPWVDYLFRRNPIRNWLPFVSSKNALVTRIARGEIEKRQLARGEGGRPDILGSLLQVHEKDPQRLTYGDVFAITHGNMSVPPSENTRNALNRLD